MKKDKIKLMCLTGVFTAVVFIFTAYLHIPSHMGYFHAGDGFIFLAACMLPLPYAVFAASCGALLADCFTGFAVWAVASVVIKAAIVMLFCRKTDKIVTLKNILMLVPAAIISIGGYYLYEALLVGNFLTPLSCVHTNVIQAVISSTLYIIVGIILDKMKFKEKYLF